MEKARALPSASVSGGSIQASSRKWPALNSNPAGFANSNSIVRAATSRHLIGVEA